MTPVTPVTPCSRAAIYSNLIRFGKRALTKEQADMGAASWPALRSFNEHSRQPVSLRLRYRGQKAVTLISAYTIASNENNDAAIVLVFKK